VSRNGRRLGNRPGGQTPQRGFCESARSIRSSPVVASGPFIFGAVVAVAVRLLAVRPGCAVTRLSQAEPGRAPPLDRWRQESRTTHAPHSRLGGYFRRSGYHGRYARPHLLV
jgi:hypothetical protein